MVKRRSAAPSQPIVGVAAATEAAEAGADAETLELRRVQADAYLTFVAIGRALEKRVAEQFRLHGLVDVTPAQANALMILFAAREPLQARTLAERMELSAVTVGRFLKALEQQGWVDRTVDPDDARAMRVRPTRRAYETLPTFIAVSNTMLDQAFAGFSRAEIRRIATVAGRVRSNLVETE